MKREFTAEHKEKLRQAQLGKKYPNRKPMSEEQKEKLRQSYKLRAKEVKLPDSAVCGRCNRVYLTKLFCLFCDQYGKVATQ